MTKFVEKPNLPKYKVNCVIAGVLCRELYDYLDNKGIEILHIEPNLNIDAAVSFHADMAVLHLGGNKIILERNQKELADTLKNGGFEVYRTDSFIKGEYPSDIGLNFTVMADKIIGKTDSADRKLTELTGSLKNINVRQGYCKCSCLVVDENAIITDDESIYKVLLNNGVEALKIDKGDIRLPGHNYGFIGGASCKISQDEILFFGDITGHRDYKKIAGFIEKHGFKIEYLKFPLTDFGGIIPITEKAP